MLKKILGSVMVVSSLMVIAGCSEQSPSGPEQTTTLNPQCGKFGLSSMGKLEKRGAAAAVQSGPQVTFNLGQIKGSSGFFFLLYNVGMIPVTNVTLSIDNPAFSVFPSSMDTLIPGGDVGMLPVVKIAAFHGTPYDGVGNRPLLPMGENTFVLHISGNSKTASGTDTVITLDAEMNLEALVMDLAFEGMNGQLEVMPVGGVNTSELANVGENISTLANFVTFCNGDSTIIIRNTGNVPLHCIIYRSLLESSAYQASILSDSVISSGNSMSITLDTIANSYYIVASGDNAVADPSKLTLNDDGTYCARITMGTYDCLNSQVEMRYNAYLAAHEQDQCRKIWAFINNNILIYGQNYRDGDSVVFVLYDLVNDVQLSSFSGTLNAVVQDDCYKDDLLASYTDVINTMSINGMADKDFGGGSEHFSGGGSSNWVTTDNFSLTMCLTGN